MEVIVTKQFEKDADKELDKAKQLKLLLLIERMQQAASIDAIKMLKTYLIFCWILQVFVE